MTMDIEAITRRVRALAIGDRPFLLGICGGPGSGKSTLSETLAEAFADQGLRAVNCPIDGFHLTNARLDALGLRAIKGRMETYDVAALKAATQKLRDGVIGFHWPLYSRVLHDPVAEGVLVPEDVNIAIVEGNYILSDMDGWRDVRALLDYKLFLECPEPLLEERLLARHLASGRTRDLALRKIAEVDLPNARAIAATAPFADLVIENG